jgi:tetratricopeptide (TPR) repeat protein/predicted Ser/Thr protein kinase
MEIPTAGTESIAPDNAFAPASVIAEHYRVERELGRGGMATVYLCTDLRDQKQVAIKILRHELGSAVVIERFLREIAFASELDHPQIPKVLASGVIDDVPYYVMTYVEGESLKKRLDREKQLPIADALKIACAVIEPTAYAHKRGIVHRDLKPDNILIAKDGVFVLDFGIARAIIESGGDRLTSTGIGVGTPAYMSPEQALGDRNLDVRSDIYSIGCVVYEMIAGIPPFVGPTAQVIISRRFAAPPPPLTEVRDNVPESVEDAIMKALAKSPADRWATVSEFGDALRACTTDSGRRFRTPTIEFRRQSVVRVGLATIALVAVGGGFLWSRQYRGAFDKGQQALQSWDFASAEQSFRRAAESNQDDPRAKLWLAQVMLLQGEPASAWRPLIAAARARRKDLSDNDPLRADALASRASDGDQQDCSRFSRLAATESRRGPGDFTAALALADCLGVDSIVVPDKASKSGYRFRASYQVADSIYEGLLERHSGKPAAYAVLVPRLANVLSIHKATYRHGSTLGPSAESFLAVPTLVDDTLTYTPSPIGAAPWRSRDPAAAVDAALTRNRERLKSFADAWARAAPDEPRAHELLASVFQAMGNLSGGDNSALEELRKARKAALRNESDENRYAAQLRLGRDQVRLYLRLSRFEQAGALADSLLSASLPKVDQAVRDGWIQDLTPLAALRGRPLEMLELALKRTPDYPVLLPNGQIAALPRQVVPDQIALDTYAQAGGNGDSVMALASRVSDKIAGLVPPAQAAALTSGALLRPLTLAAPMIGPKPVADLEPSPDPIILALRAYAARDMPRTRRFLDSLSALHADYAPGEITMDAVYVESWLRAQIGDTAAASGALDRALRGLPAALPSILANEAVAFSLGRVMGLRAELAARKQQGTLARSWSTALLQLWGRGDAVTAPTLERMRKLQ